MNVLIKYANGETLNPVYSPEHRESVISFYEDMIANHMAMSITITMDDGEVIRMVEA